MNTPSDYFIEITDNEFYRQIGEDKKASVVNFQNFDYKKGPTYSLSMRPQAINYCQSKMAQQLKSIIVESSHFITVWNQLTNNQASASSSVNKSPENTQQSNSNQAQQSTQKIPTKKVIRRYRGQTYEVEVPDYAALKNNQNQQPTQRKKYRGQYIN